MPPPPVTSPESDLCWSLFESMLRLRQIEETIASRYGAQQMRCPVHLSIGQEAPAAGLGAVLSRADRAMSGHRSHAHYLAKGGNLSAMIAEMHGKASGCSKGRGGSMHLVDLEAGFVGAVPIVASTISIATGLAFADHRLGNERVTAAFFGDAAAEEGVFHESLNFAHLHRLPILYVCENNQYSVYSPLSVRQAPDRSLRDIAAGHGLPSFSVDGNDALAVHGAAKYARDLALAGVGPVFLELATYRWREHCGPGFDNTIGYRSEDEFLAWKALDPIQRMKEVLLKLQCYNEDRQVRFQAELNAELDAAFTAALQAPFPTPETLHDFCYA